jgi:hypothetical protein
MHGPLALGQTAVKQARDRVRAANSLLERGPRQAERALTSRERKGRACLCGAGYCPQKWNGSRPDVPKPGGPFPNRTSCLRPQMAPAPWSFDPQLGGDHGLNCRSTYKRQTSTRQKIPPHSVLLCIETNCVPCHECSKRPLRSLPSTQWRRATPSYPRMAVA